MKRSAAFLDLIICLLITISATSQTTHTLSSNVKKVSAKCSAFNINMLANNIPSLSWNSDQDGKTDFEVQRSYNGHDFTTVAIVFSMRGNVTYQYKDKQANPKSTPVYYRIKAIENGTEELSETKSVRRAVK